MESRYKIIVSSKNIYREIELPSEATTISLGTEVECNFRLRKNLFFEPVVLNFTRDDEEWYVTCSDNLYMTVGDVRKLMTKRLNHGDIIFIKYQNSDNEVFNIEFLIDFDNGERKYDRALDLSGVSSFTIGSSSDCQVQIMSSYVMGDVVRLEKTGSSFMLTVHRSNYGVNHNGSKVHMKEEIKNGDFFSISDFFFYYKNGLLWTENRPDLVVRSIPARDARMPGSYPRFKRNTRLKLVVDDEKIEILDPPAKPQKPKNNLLMRLLPSLGMLVASGVMALIGGATMLIFSGISGIMAIVTSVMGLRETNKDFKKNSAERIEKYNNYIQNKRAEIEQARETERRNLEEIYTSQEQEQKRFSSFSADLFDRTLEDEDFLCVRLGSGDVEAKREINYKKQERLEIEDDLQTMPEQLSNEYKYVHNAPIVCDLKSIDALGVIGEPAFRLEMMKNMVIDLAARQYYTDVQMVFVANEEHKDQVRWLRMLPHVYNTAIGVRNIVCDDESRNIIFEYLYKEMSLREQNKHFDSRIVVFFYDQYGFNSHPISKFVDRAKDLGVCFVFFGSTRGDLPVGCDYVICPAEAGGKQAKLINTVDKEKPSVFSYPSINLRQAEAIVNLLAPVYTEEISLESTLTKNISMFELLNILAVDDLDLAARWASTQVSKSMAAPIGVSKSGVVSLDLHDKAHGPHGLVAGTTGSGKSEILQTYILAMSTLFHPYEVGFVIIDFKGGGMVNQFKDLPHLLGAITNIDGKEINRSLKSIKAELQKRQRLFAEANVNHIDKYIAKYKAREVNTPLPHLIIIVDEFAELKAEQPEFMKELISAARIGRSLGVHLILATQKPSGQVNEQIWSNSRFKLCLKVQSQEDSNEVIKSPLAAEIKEPGRAYLQVGNNEIFELFQSAYSGAAEKAEASNVREFAVYKLTDSGRRIPIYVQKREKSGENNITQLDAIVKYVASYCNTIGLKKLPDICLPSLSDRIDFPQNLTAAAGNGHITAEIGMYDDPDNQYQGTYTIDLTNDNLLLIGSSQSGKTNILQGIIRSLSTKYSPKEVNIYIMDFASMVLKTFEPLNHVGGVVTSSEDEKLRNLMKLLFSEIESRKEKLLSVGVSSFSAYKEAGREDLPQIVLIIDNLTALKELYFQDDDELLSLCREGLTVGISVVIANSQTAGIGYKYLSNFASRIALFCNDSGEYSALFDHCRERLENIPGRCIVEIDKVHLECQSYLAFEGEKEIERVENIRAYIRQINARNPRSMARIIPVIPELLNTAFVERSYMGFMQEKSSLVVGLDYASVMPYVMDFRSLGVLAVSGREKSGKHNFMKYVVSMFERNHKDAAEVYIVDSINRKLQELKDIPAVREYSFLPEKAPEYVKLVEAKLKERYDALAAGDEEVLSSSSTLMLILNSADAVEAINGDTTAMTAYRNITGKYKNMGVCIILGAYENANVPYGAPEILKKVKEARHFMFFDDLANMKILDMPLSVLRNFKKPIEVGDCYYIRDNDCRKLKSVLYTK